jgi:GNAT superfamily N-acetyltransferase
VHVRDLNLKTDTEGFEQWLSVWRATDHEKFPDEEGWDGQDVRAMVASHDERDTKLLLALTDDREPAGAAMLQLPLRDNRHAVWVDFRVLSEHRRRGVGRAMVEATETLARADGRTVLNGIADAPVGQEDTHPSTPFARAMGFGSTLGGNRRRLVLPMDPGRLEMLRKDVEGARGAADYRIIKLIGPWPAEFVEDQCALERAMSTDQPLGDAHAEEEDWDTARVEEAARTLEASGLISVVAAAQHIESGRLVAYSRIAVAERRPMDAWQWATIVLHAHRGHRLGLAVKLANLDYLADVLPTARRVITSNAAVNAPMIAVNDLMGFEIDAVGMFWQKTLEEASS